MIVIVVGSLPVRLPLLDSRTLPGLAARKLGALVVVLLEVAVCGREWHPFPTLVALAIEPLARGFSGERDLIVELSAGDGAGLCPSSENMEGSTVLLSSQDSFVPGVCRFEEVDDRPSAGDIVSSPQRVEAIV